MRTGDTALSQRFWKHFRNMPGRALDWGGDAIFDAENDLVVDTASMIRLGSASIMKGSLRAP